RGIQPVRPAVRREVQRATGKGRAAGQGQQGDRGRDGKEQRRSHGALPGAEVDSPDRLRSSESRGELVSDDCLNGPRTCPALRGRGLFQLLAVRLYGTNVNETSAPSVNGSGETSG